MTTSPDFDIRVVAEKHGSVVQITQKTGVAYDPMFGSFINPVSLTPYEAEKLVQEINAAIKLARQGGRTP
jgi:hypothetical protein